MEKRRHGSRRSSFCTIQIYFQSRICKIDFISGIRIETGVSDWSKLSDGESRVSVLAVTKEARNRRITT